MHDKKDTNPLDLNNYPNEFAARGSGKQTQFEAGSSSSGHRSRKKKKDSERGKLYECRFYSLKFCKSQALGGHMNRHRKERETETLNKARMLLFSNENNMPTVHGLPAHHLGGQMAVPNGGFHQQGITDPAIHFRPVYPVQSFSMRLPASTPQPYVLYPSPPRPHFTSSYSSNYKPSNDCCLGDVHRTTSPLTANYTCIGSPVVGLSNLNFTYGPRENGTSLAHSGIITNGARELHIANQDDGQSRGTRGV